MSLFTSTIIVYFENKVWSKGQRCVYTFKDREEQEDEDGEKENGDEKENGEEEMEDGEEEKEERKEDGEEEKNE